MNNKYNIYLGLGTNQGNKKENLKRAIELLSLALGKYNSLSSFIETEPWGFESQNLFCNCVVEYTTALSPLELLDITESREKELGRTTKSSNGIYHDRIIDIDILLYGNEIISNDRLTIPHSLMHQRHFVLEPLAEISANIIHPTSGKKIAQLLKEIKQTFPGVSKK